jgi:hypothetical protein
MDTSLTHKRPFGDPTSSAFDGKSLRSQTLIIFIFKIKHRLNSPSVFLVMRDQMPFNRNLGDLIIYE